MKKSVMFLVAFTLPLLMAGTVHAEAFGTPTVDGVLDGVYGTAEASDPAGEHWDGNNNSIDERNLSAGFGTGATPTTLDKERMLRIRNWLLDASPPPYPEDRIDRVLAAAGEPIYAEYCLACHGTPKPPFRGEGVGQRGEAREGRCNHHVDRIGVGHQRQERLGEGLRLGTGLVHLPVGGQDGAAHA